MDAASPKPTPVGRRLTALVAALVATALVAVTLTIGAPRPAAASQHVGALALAAGEEGGLAFTGSAGDAAEVAEVAEVELTTALAADIGWDLTGLDRGRYRSDLVRLELDGFEGPGALTATTPSPFGGTDVLLDPASEGDGFVLQVGRQGTMRWTFDQPGSYRVQLSASIPEAGGGIATARADYRLTVTDGPVPDTTAPDRPVPATVGPRTSSDEGVGPGGPPRSVQPSSSAAPAQAATATGRVVIGEGHVDMGPRFVDGSWRVQLRDDSVSPIAWRDLADVVLHARESSRIEVPPGDAFAFLGAPGSQVYVLPLVQQPGLVWPGWNTQDPSVLDAVPGDVTWRLHGVEGPGRFLLYLTGTFGQTDILFDTAAGLPQDLIIGRNTHVHGNWAFTEAGIYRLSVEMSATTSDGTPVSDTRILTIAVGDAADPDSAFTPDPNPNPDPGPGPGPDPSSTDVEITATLGDDPASGGGGGAGGVGAGRGGGQGGGSLVRTGIDDIGVELALGVALIAAGAALVAYRRRQLRIKVENHS